MRCGLTPANALNQSISGARSLDEKVVHPNFVAEGVHRPRPTRPTDHMWRAEGTSAPGFLFASPYYYSKLRCGAGWIGFSDAAASFACSAAAAPVFFRALPSRPKSAEELCLNHRLRPWLAPAGSLLADALATRRAPGVGIRLRPLPGTLRIRSCEGASLVPYRIALSQKPFPHFKLFWDHFSLHLSTPVLTLFSLYLPIPVLTRRRNGEHGNRGGSNIPFLRRQNVRLYAWPTRHLLAWGEPARGLALYWMWCESPAACQMNWCRCHSTLCPKEVLPGGGSSLLSGNRRRRLGEHSEQKLVHRGTRVPRCATVTCARD